MTKKNIKKILISMRTPENESILNHLLGKLDLLTDKEITSLVNQIGNSEENIRNFIKAKLEEKQVHHNEQHTPINKMFTYGITGESIHLHMPVDLHQMMLKIGPLKTLYMVNLQLLDAIERIRKLQNDGYYKFKGTDSIYMISPLLFAREIKFLNELDFKTHIYTRKELQDDKFVSEHPEAQLATRIFGKKSNIGTAVIKLDVVNSDKWQEKRRIKVQEFEKKGLKIDEKGKYE